MLAVWLGPEEDDSSLAMDLLHDMVDRAESRTEVKNLIASLAGKRDPGGRRVAL